MRSRLLPLVLALACLACLRANAQDAGVLRVAAPSGKHVVVLGSSTATGWGPVHPQNAWVNRFYAAAREADPERVVTNLAVAGYTTYQLLPNGFVPPAGRPAPDPDHNITAAIARGADAILVNLPSNDAAQGFSVAEQLANYDVILGAAAAAGIPVWITTTQPRNESSAVRDSLAAMRDSTLARWGDHAVDFWTTLANPDGTIDPIFDSGDGIHLNDAAHGVLFRRVEAKDVWARIAPHTPPVTVPVGESAGERPPP